MWIILSVLLDTEYLTKNTKKHLYLIENGWIWFVPRLLVKNKQLTFKQYLLLWYTFSQHLTTEGLVMMYHFNNWLISNFSRIKKHLQYYYISLHIYLYLRTSNWRRIRTQIKTLWQFLYKYIINTYIIHLKLSY